jgi:2-hydroxy-4-carboxymuconate semialdehyde hemiacetal dehydrogenase
VSLIGRELAKTREVAAKYGIGHVTTELTESLALPGLDAVILCTPTQMHAAQTVACLQAGKHVQVEIPLADSLAGAQDVVAWQKKTGLVAMCGHTRRFNPSHQWVRRRILASGFFWLDGSDAAHRGPWKPRREIRRQSPQHRLHGRGSLRVEIRVRAVA